MWKDRAFRIAYRLAFPLVDRWWRFRKNHEGAIIAVWLEDRVLAVRHSYKPEWRLPAGGVARGEDHRLAAVRELREEVGFVIDPRQLSLVCSFDSCYGREHLYATRIDAMPKLQIDFREIIEAEFLPPASVHMPDPHIAAYLAPHATTTVA